MRRQGRSFFLLDKAFLVLLEYRGVPERGEDRSLTNGCMNGRPVREDGLRFGVCSPSAYGAKQTNTQDSKNLTILKVWQPRVAARLRQESN